MNTQKLEQVHIDKLVPYARNARTHSKEQIAQLRASLREFGFVSPAVIDADYNILVGPIAPHLLFPQFLDDNNPEERELGLFFGNALMSKCAEVWVFGSRISSGMEAEIKRAKWKGYRLRYFTEECQEV